jgi:AraC family transcriptional regulator
LENIVESGKHAEQFAGFVQWWRFAAARYVRRHPTSHVITPLSSIVPAAAPRNPASVRQASRAWRRPMRGVLSLADQASSGAHPCSVDVCRGAQRLVARWSTTKTSGLSIDRRDVARTTADCGEMRVHLRGTIDATGVKAGTVHFGSHLVVRIDSDDVFARECIARLFDPGWQGGETSALFADALLRTLALHVFTRYAPRAAEPARHDDRLAEVLVRELESFVDARLDRRLSRSDLARIAGYEARAFSFVFRNTFGMTPMQYVIERRLDRACLLIAGTTQDLADIAISAGFSSQSHLTSTLKKRRGITPLRLRRQSARRAPAP